MEKIILVWHFSAEVFNIFQNQISFLGWGNDQNKASENLKYGVAHGISLKKCLDLYNFNNRVSSVPNWHFFSKEINKKINVHFQLENSTRAENLKVLKEIEK